MDPVRFSGMMDMAQRELANRYALYEQLAKQTVAAPAAAKPEASAPEAAPRRL